MSSNHTLISRNEWVALQQRINSAEAYVINRQAEAQRIAELIRTRQREIETMHHENQIAIQQSVSSLASMFNENVAMVRGQINSQLRAQADAFGSQLQGLHNEISNTSDRLSSFDSRINTLADTYDNIFRELANREQSSMERANLIINELDRLILMIEQLNPQQFSPSEYATLLSLRESIRSNINVGDNQAAIIVSQNSIMQATRLLAQLQLANERYNERASAVRDDMLRIQQRIERLSSKDGVLSVDIGGSVEEYDYDISFWSHGAFDLIVQDYYRLQNQLNENALTLEQLNQISYNLNILDENISICDENARRERAGALIAADAALRLHSGFTNSNWSLESSGYASDDERNPYAMTYINSAGSTVSVVISPESPENPSISMEVFSDDDELAAITKDGIHASLEDEGVRIESREQRDDCHLNPETFIENSVAEAQEILDQRRMV